MTYSQIYNAFSTHLTIWKRTFVAVAIGFAVFVSASQRVDFSLDLEPNATHQRTSTIIVDQVRAHHLLRSKVLDDLASVEIFERYLKTLDHSKRFLLQSDIDEFEVYRLYLDDALVKGDLEPAYFMFNRMRQRSADRINWVLERLEIGIDSFDLETDQTLQLDADDRTFPVDEHEADELWEKTLISNIISAKLDAKSNEEIMERLVKRFKSQLRQLGQIKTEEVFSRYMSAFTKSFDPHTEYLSPRDKEEFGISMSLSMEGIGARLEIKDDHVQIKELVQGGPAFREGSLKENDQIVSVGQSPTSPMINVVGWRLDDVVDLIRGPKGTVVVLGIQEPNALAADLKTVQITRDTIQIDDLAAKKNVIDLKHNDEDFKVGFIELNSMYRDFKGAEQGNQGYRSATRDVKALIEELKEEGVEGLVMDLRRNGGGSLDEAVSLVGLFISTGPTVQVRGIGRRISVLQDRDSSVAWEGPLAVLVDEFSASASEIFAGAIQDYQRGIVIGNQTFGKGTVQSLVAANQGQLKITQAKFYRINGASTQLKGVIPDVIIDSLAQIHDTGERTYDGALPWDQINSLRYSTFADNAEKIAQVQLLHEQRKQDNPYFNFLSKLAEQAKRDKERTAVSLNFHEREQELEDRNQWRIDISNPYLSAHGIEPAKDLDELDDRMDELDDQVPEEIALEASRILLDYTLPQEYHVAAISDAESLSGDEKDTPIMQGRVESRTQEVE